jgi:hypothetical protein
MKYYVTENRNLKVWPEKQQWQDDFDKQDEILTSPELKEQLTPGQVIEGDSFKWNRAKTFDPGKYIKDNGFEFGCAECCNGDCDCEVGERCKFKGNRKGCTYCKGECFYKTENDVPKIAVPLDTATEESNLREVETFQSRLNKWMQVCFGKEISSDITERNHRFIEEALELVQSTGITKGECYQLVDYVFDRPVGDPFQEVGGVIVTLSALCNAMGLSVNDAGEAELKRIWTKVDKIREKQANKPKHSPLPEAARKALATPPDKFTRQDMEEKEKEMWNNVIVAIAAAELFQQVKPEDVNGIDDWKSRKIKELKEKYSITQK